jgi:aryl-alcohol dehydrogenase-like predicted oxidoreductase
MLKPSYKKDIYASDFTAKGSRLVYGTSGLGGVWGEVDEAESIDCLLYAFENGITSLDTSPSYSQSEKYVGKALKSPKFGVCNRQQLLMPFWIIRPKA